MGLKWWHLGLIISLIMAGIISIYASSSPDGLERVAEDKGFISKGKKEVIHSPMPEYTIPGISNVKLSTSLAGLVGTLLVFLLMYSMGKALKGEKRNGA
ncbi:MAG: PDGLE domain-containing protein [Candidatus Hydrothermarchaeota archaeon]